MSLHVNASLIPPYHLRVPPRLSPGASSEEEDDEAVEFLRALHERGDDKQACIATVTTPCPFDSGVRYSSCFHIADSYDLRGYTYFSFKPDSDSLSLFASKKSPSRLKIFVQDKELDIRRVIMSNSLWTTATSGGALSMNGRAHVIARPLTQQDVREILGRSSDCRSEATSSPDLEVMEYMSRGEETSFRHIVKIEEIKLRCLFQ